MAVWRMAGVLLLAVARPGKTDEFTQSIAAKAPCVPDAAFASPRKRRSAISISPCSIVWVSKKNRSETVPDS
ncbi:hypothetical protein SBA3_3660014 [Candidatus Sulfopaludibacter sp. SbA3]|nr:hypothetical protein SBA3_3660014 [Candidatus Sulfopaludibacter sp. SbA3]